MAVADAARVVAATVGHRAPTPAPGRRLRRVLQVADGGHKFRRGRRGGGQQAAVTAAVVAQAPAGVAVAVTVAVTITVAVAEVANVLILVLLPLGGAQRKAARVVQPRRRLRTAVPAGDTARAAQRRRRQCAARPRPLPLADALQPVRIPHRVQGLLPGQEGRGDGGDHNRVGPGVHEALA